MKVNEVKGEKQRGENDRGLQAKGREKEEERE